MSLAKKLVYRMLAYIVILGYLALDLLVFKGPLSRTLSGEEKNAEQRIAEAKASGVVARVYFQPIYQKQVEERMRESLWREGREPSDLNAGEAKVLREAIVGELIDELLVKIQIKVSGVNDFPVSEQEIQNALARFNDRFTAISARDAAMAQQGWAGGEHELKMRLAGRLQREKYLQSQLAEFIQEDSEALVRAWYDEHHQELKGPDGELPSYEEAKASIASALKARQREKGWDDFCKIMRAKAGRKIEIFRDMLHQEATE